MSEGYISTYITVSTPTELVWQKHQVLQFLSIFRGKHIERCTFITGYKNIIHRSIAYNTGYQNFTNVTKKKHIY
jgi:hypothetical protein